MALGAGAAMHVDLGWVEAKIANGCHGHHGKCLIYLKQINVIFMPANLG